MWKRVLLGIFAVIGFAQTTITNETVIKMVKAGLSDDIVASTIASQPGRYTVTPDDLIALKGAGVSDRIMFAMVEKMKSAPAAPSSNPLVSLAKAAPATVTEIGVYYKKGDQWADLPPEVVHFKTGGVLKTIGTAGIVKRDVNGHLNGANSPNQLKTPVTLLVYTPEGVAITEYQLLRLREDKDSREFRTVTGGVLHTSGGATRDLVPFENRKTAPRTYEIVLPNLGAGNYGLLPATSTDQMRNGKLYSFRIVE